MKEGRFTHSTTAFVFISAFVISALASPATVLAQCPEGYHQAGPGKWIKVRGEGGKEEERWVGRCEKNRPPGPDLRITGIKIDAPMPPPGMAPSGMAFHY